MSTVSNTTGGPIINQAQPIPTTIVVAVVCGVLVALLIGWAIMEATSRARSNFMAWCTGKPEQESKSPSQLTTVDSIIWSAKENGTPIPEIVERPPTPPIAPTKETLPPPTSPSAIISYYMRTDNVTTPNLTFPTSMLSPISLSYYELTAPPHTPDMRSEVTEEKIVMENAMRIMEWRKVAVTNLPQVQPRVARF